MSDIIFQKSLQDVIKGIRSHKQLQHCSEFVSQEITNMKTTELKSHDPFIKAEAIRKLTYLQMIGYNISWAAFSIVEVMSFSRFAHKQIGYLAANQSFTDSTDLILLTTNLYKKEFSSSSIANQYEVGLALNSLSNIVTTELGRDCLSDIVGLITHSLPYLRKKAVLALYRVYIKYPSALRLTFDLIKERLEDSDSSVVSTAVSVICELANRNPKNYLALAPKFFGLLTTSSNNWLLIKLVKLFGLLVSEEPRLARKLIDPLVTIIQNNAAKSLQYECIYTLTIAFQYTKKEDGSDAKNVPNAVSVCSEHLRGFISDPDQNLKYLGLVGLITLMRSHAKVVIDHRESILRCLVDADYTIRTKALELLGGIVSRKSLEDIVKHLLQHLAAAEGVYRDHLIGSILQICAKDKYANTSDFPWFISTLVSLSTQDGSSQGATIANHLMDVTLRVRDVRAYSLHSLLPFLLDEDRILSHPRDSAEHMSRACAWVAGEYSSFLTQLCENNSENEEFWMDGPDGKDVRSVFGGQELHTAVYKSLLSQRVLLLSDDTQAVFVHAAMKVFIRACLDCAESSVAAMIALTRTMLEPFLRSPSLEVMERASSFRHLLAALDILPSTWSTNHDSTAQNRPSVERDGEPLLSVDVSGATRAKQMLHILSALVGEPFYVVSSKAQRKVPVPEGMDLNKPFNSKAFNAFINSGGSNVFDFSVTPQTLSLFHGKSQRLAQIPESHMYNSMPQERAASLPQEFSSEREKLVPMSTQPISNVPTFKDKGDNLFYLRSSSSMPDVSPLSKVLLETFDEGPKKSKKVKKAKKADKKSKVDVDTLEMQPSGALDSDDETPRNRRSKGKTAAYSAEMDSLDYVDITTPLRPDEVIPVQKHRSVTQSYVSPASVAESELPDTLKEKSKKKSSKKKKSKAKSIDAIGDLLGMDWPAQQS